MLQKHHHSHHKLKKGSCSCDVCSNTFNTYRELAQHRRDTHADLTPVQTFSLKCSDCEETFDAHYKLHAHRVKCHHTRHAVDRIDNPDMMMPWEKDTNIDPPWIARDERGNSQTDLNFKHIYQENRDTIHANHDLGVVRAVYNFPINDFDGDTVILRPQVERILAMEPHSFKINLAFGTILRNIETGEYRYFTAYYNNTILDLPFRISTPDDINAFLHEVEENISLEFITTTSRESTKWEKVYVTNITFFVYRMGYVIGHGRQKKNFQQLPRHIYRHHAIVSMISSTRRKPYKDNLCSFRCLAWLVNKSRTLEKRTKLYYRKWKTYKESLGQTDLPNDGKKYKGVFFEDLPDFEKCFKVKVYVYTLSPEDTCERVYHSSLKEEDQADRTMYLNVFDHHFSLITNFNSYAKKFACRFCSRAFNRMDNTTRHEKSCTERVSYTFSGGIYQPSLSIFDEIQSTLGITVPSELQYFPWFAVYDFESVLKPVLVQDINTANTQITTEHIPVCVSISSNVPGYTEPHCIIDEDPDDLVKKMCDQLEKIQLATVELAKARWSHLYNELQTHLVQFPSSEVTNETMQAHNVNMEHEFVTADNITESQDTLHIGCMDHEETQKLHCSRVADLVSRLDSYMECLPVLGFNSSKYDLNLIKKYFPKHLQLTTDRCYVVKKCNQYTAICNSKFKLLDITNYLAAGCNYSRFLQAYDVQESKSYFPYEWFDSVDKLKFQNLPSYDSFYSKLKNCNVLNSEHEEWQHKGCKGIEPKNGHTKYQDLLTIWEEKGMSKFEHFLQHYANLDTGPFVQGAEKLQKYYFDMGVDVFKVAISAPGVARRLLFQHAKKQNKYFASFDRSYEDLYYKIKKCAFGGPSIIFKRHAKVGHTLIRGNQDRICGSIQGYDCNGLYLFALGQELPVLFPIRRSEEKSFKPEVSWRHLEMYQWLNWMAVQDGLDIQHKLNSGKEFPVGPYRLDGFATSVNDKGESVSHGYEFHGCWTHGHDPELCSFNREVDGSIKFSKNQKTIELQKKKRKATYQREKYIRDRKIDLKVIYECQFAQLKKKNPDIRTYINHIFPEFYLSYPRSVSTQTILQNVENGKLTGFLQVDIKVPEKWPKGKEREVSPYEYFSEMAPIFCNSEVHFDDWGSTMQSYSLSQMSGMFTESRKLLVGGMGATKIFLATNLLKWYLDRGLEVSKVYEVVEYKFEKCFEGFCDYISEARRLGDSDPSKEILGETCKVLGNASYGSLLLDKTKHSDVKYVHSTHTAHLAVNEPSFKSSTELPGDIFEIEKSKKKIELDIPIQLAFTILQSAKLKMLEFYYDCLDYYVDRKNFELTHMDTDSLYYSISGKTLRDVIIPSKLEEFDNAIFNNCYDFDESGNPFRACHGIWFPRECCEKHTKYDKRERGLFKLEATGIELIALAPKTYHLTRENEPDCVKAKGINKSAIMNAKELYQKALLDRETGSADNIGFKPINNTIVTYTQRRRGFNFFYVKRTVMPNGIDTVPLKSVLNPWENHNTFVLKPDKHCLSLDYQAAMQKHGAVFRSCSHLFAYEMALYHDRYDIAREILKCKNQKKVISLVKSITLKNSWYTDRDEIMNSIIWQKIDKMKYQIISTLRETKDCLIVQPGARSDGYFTCGLSTTMAEISNPRTFPGSDMMSIFWHNVKADQNFMQS